MQVIKFMLLVIGTITLVGCASVKLTPQERESIRSAATKVLPPGAKVAVDTQSRFLSKSDLVISAHLLEGHSADEKSPYVRGDYGTHEKLTRLVRFRSARIVKSILTDTTLPNVGGIIVNAFHGVRQTDFNKPNSVRDVAMTLYTARFVLESTTTQSKGITEEQIIDRFQVKRDIIPSLSIR